MLQELKKNQDLSCKELTIVIVKQIVDYPEEVVVNEVEGNQTNVLELRVDKADVGKVIGKRGRTADALRTILQAVSIKINKRIVLEIID